MRLAIIAFFSLVIPQAAFSQGGNGGGSNTPQIQYVSADPTGQTCSNYTIKLLTPNGVFYTCQSGHIARLPAPSSGPGSGSGNSTICNASASATVPTCPGVPAPTSLTGLTGTLVIQTKTSGAPTTLNIAGLGTPSLYLNGVATTAANVLPPGVYSFYYDGSVIQAQGLTFLSGGVFTNSHTLTAADNGKILSYTQGRILTLPAVAPYPFVAIAEECSASFSLTINATSNSAVVTGQASPTDITVGPANTAGQCFSALITSVSTSQWSVAYISGTAAGLHVAQVEITGAQLAAINSTPVTLLPAPGAGKAISSILTSALTVFVFPTQFKAGTTPYTFYGDLNLGIAFDGVGPLAGTARTIAGLEAIDVARIGTDYFWPNGEWDSIDDTLGVVAKFENKAWILTADPESESPSTGRITASNVTAGQAGLLYAPGDTFTINTGDGLAAGVVDTVGGGGNVLTYHLTAQGTTYPVSAGVATTTTSGVGSGLQLDITAIQSVADGDGSIWLTIPYIVVDLH